MSAQWPWLALLALLLPLAACQPKKAPVFQPPPVETSRLTQLPAAPVSAAEIDEIMQAARSGGDPQRALAELDRLASQAPVPINEEALFRKAELMLEFRLPGALDMARAVMAVYPHHALVPYEHFWMAKWWLEEGDAAQAMEELTQALKHPRLTRELADEVLSLGPSVAREVPEWDALQWMLSAAELDAGGRQGWLQMAARRVSVPTLERLHLQQAASPDLLASLDRYTARLHLLTGEKDIVQQIADLLARFAPTSEAMLQVQQWATGEASSVTIGVLLPLTGSYAIYGQQAMRGLRMALAGSEIGDRITLRIEDTGGDPARAVEAYRHLADESVAMVIGPLLAETTEALVSQIDEKVPVLSLSNRVDLAKRSKALFVHTLSPLAQTQFLASYARQQGAERMVVIREATPGSMQEAELFAQAFTDFGGEIAYMLTLPENALDVRPLLRIMREGTDDEELLAALDEDMDLFIAEQNLELRMPVNFDAVYLAVSGKRVALLAGQLAYMGITDIPLYGSSHWNDGHVLDDRGRYLKLAHFVAPDPGGGDPQRLRRVRFLYREAWGSQEPDDLSLLAYDSLLIAALVSSRLGLEGRDLIAGLQDPNGFPALTGQVIFDADGIGQKKLDMFMIRDGKVVPAG